MKISNHVKAWRIYDDWAKWMTSKGKSPDEIAMAIRPIKDIEMLLRQKSDVIKRWNRKYRITGGLHE